MGLSGPNGAGKTTLLHIIAGLEAHAGGEVSFAEQPLDAARRGAIGFVTHTVQLYPKLSARENVELFARLHAAAGRATSPAREVLAAMGLGDAADRAVGTFSRGMKQRVALARALAMRPELLLLDEPFTSLDADGRETLVKQLRSLVDGGLALLVVSHDAQTLAAATDRVLRFESGVLN